MINKSKTSLERCLYAALNLGRGVSLIARDVVELVDADDAMQCRITNALATEFGYPEPGAASLALFGANGSIEKFKRQLKENSK